MQFLDGVGAQLGGADIGLVYQEHDVGGIFFVDDSLEGIGSDGGSNGFHISHGRSGDNAVGYFHGGEDIAFVALGHGEVEHEIALCHVGVVGEVYGNGGCATVLI